MNTPYAPTYYAATANPVPNRPALQGEISADICIIGAGYTGLSTGLFLAEQGLKVVVLEAAKVGFGATGRNGGQIVNSFSRDIDAIERQVGHDAAKVFGQMAFEGNRIIRERISTYDIKCDLKNGGVFAAFTPKQMRHLEHQRKLWARHGHNTVDMLDKKQMSDVVGSDVYVGGSIDHSGGHFHSLNLALGEAAAIESLGGTIYEQSPVIRIERGAKPVVITELGRVNARTVVVAGNAYLGNLVPELSAKSMPCGSQVVTTAPLPADVAKSLIPNDHCIEDCNYLLDYYRLTGDNRLLYGGGVIYGARDPKNVEAIIRPKMLKTFPQLQNVKIDYAWTGNFLLTLSRLPQVGTLGEHNNIFYSQGCSGHGITYTHLAGKVLSEAIMGQRERFNAFAQLPHYPFPGGRLMRVPFTAVGAAYYSLRDKFGI
ncbi:Gamma-glutamylputrescine oxidoreductase [Ephemeroptericola cinctiostellae]|uniref:Gamma-glutamylputrescine oxidoreductase n=1 Tax=Ephemeroptericola cinctiostellae TaxID=2268024 RepID=A0A345D9M5_9BURK|nr:FAD-binding oxidoreductase [Ephemeroptericola cinctiostellae]AXF85063.1 Gamma-glutamylputrescine oxidoreductase [Ephemeroptericola cinctiostellae]